MNIDNHPCFNPKACKSHGRVHLPVAPRCNIQCNFCNRKFDCVNESRPGVCSDILTPSQAMVYLDRVIAEKKNISVVGIAGPGDPFANPEETLETLRRVSQKYPDMLLCLASNGLNLPDYIDDIARLNVSHVSITINAVDPNIGEKIYSWVRYGKRSLSPQKGAKILLDKQIESIKGLKAKGVIVKVNTIVLPGVNDHHVVEIARQMSKLGVDLFNCMPYYPNEGSNFAHLGEPSKQMITDIQKKAKAYIPQMLHCKRCRADAVGLLDEVEPDLTMMAAIKECATIKEQPVNQKILPSTASAHIAVATREGLLVNQHLGEAFELSIYDTTSEIPVMIEKRPVPDPGGGDNRWEELVQTLHDCNTVLVSGAGKAPQRVLDEHGIKVLIVNGLIQEILEGIISNSDISHLLAREPFKCSQDSCSGAGLGCM